MALDKQLEEAIREAVKEANQLSGIADKLITWLEVAISGEEDPLNEGAFTRRLELIYDEMYVDVENKNGF